jgi:hypothetical protein
MNFETKAVGQFIILGNKNKGRVYAFNKSLNLDYIH